ncbi:MAG: hypothetical protein J6A26_07030 [Oscillospiraceae bacterium]|nr:hypothetical protein [Oscillospiraceae bacterium]
MEQNFLHLPDDAMSCSIRRRCHSLQQQDPISQKDLRDLQHLEQACQLLPLDTQQRRLLNDYLACLGSLQEREVELAYLAGAEDAAQLFPLQNSK